MIIIAGQITVDAADRDAYVRESVPVIEAARGAAGCLDFSISADLLDDARINIFERWETDEELAEFRGSGPSAEQAAQIRTAEVRRYRISAIEDA